MPTFLPVGFGPKHKEQTTHSFATAEWQELPLDINLSVSQDGVGSMTDMAALATKGAMDENTLRQLAGQHLPLDTPAQATGIS